MILTGADLVSALSWCVLPLPARRRRKIVLAAVLTMQLDKRLKGLTGLRLWGGVLGTRGLQYPKGFPLGEAVRR